MEGGVDERVRKGKRVERSGEMEQLDGASEPIPDELIQGQKPNKNRNPQDETGKHIKRIKVNTERLGEVVIESEIREGK